MPHERRVEKRHRHAAYRHERHKQGREVMVAPAMPQLSQIAEKKRLDYIGEKIHGRPEERIPYHQVRHRHTEQQGEIIYPVYAPFRVMCRLFHRCKYNERAKNDNTTQPMRQQLSLRRYGKQWFAVPIVSIYPFRTGNLPSAVPKILIRSVRQKVGFNTQKGPASKGQSSNVGVL